MRHLLLCCFFFFPQYASGDETAPVDQDVYYCGEACIYGVLKFSGHETKITGIRQRIDSLAPGIDHGRMSLKQIREVIESYGLYAVTKRFRPSEYADTPPNSILFLNPDKVGTKDVGHVILMRGIDPGDTVRIVDFAAGAGGKIVTIKQLQSFWDGVAIVVSQDSTEHLVRYAEMALGCFLLVVPAVFLLRQRYKRSTVLNGNEKN